ncbi:MAG TPA: hypothetical protein VIG24_12875 [Acidimicrobiia bacterium]
MAPSHSEPTIDLDDPGSDVTLQGFTPEERREYHRLFLEMAYLSLLVNLHTEYCVFFDYSGHVWSVSIRIRRSKSRYQEEVADSEFRVVNDPGKQYGWKGVDFLRKKRDILKEILETNDVPVDQLDREVVETYAYHF